MEMMYNYNDIIILMDDVIICDNIICDKVECENVYDMLNLTVQLYLARELDLRSEMGDLWDGDGWVVTNFNTKFGCRKYHGTLKAEYTVETCDGYVDDMDNFYPCKSLVTVKSIQMGNLWDENCC